MNVLSLFDGISGGQIALERAGIPVDTYYASEVDKYAIQVTQKNYPNTIQIGDVNELDFTRYINKIDLLIGGSPCTFWSISKKNREVDKDGIGWDLFSKYIDALKIIKPKYFLYENVASMPNTIKGFISEEFGVEPILINSSLVSGQQRKRLYWTNIPDVIQPEDIQINLQSILENGYTDKLKSYCIDASYCKGGNLKQYFEKSRRQLVFNSVVDYNTYKIKYKMENIKRGNGWRMLTPLECERLQTLPDNCTEYGIDENSNIIKISDSQRYKLVGNGWTIDIITWIFSFLNT